MDAGPLELGSPGRGRRMGEKEICVQRERCDDMPIPGYLDWHSTECITPKLQAILECWIGVALRLLECRVLAQVECNMALQEATLQC